MNNQVSTMAVQQERPNAGLMLMNPAVMQEVYKFAEVMASGTATVPKHLRGTWYNRRGKKLVIDAHSINGGEIHKISGSFAPTSFEQTRRWARARMENINGIDCYHVQALNAQNFGWLYTVQKKGKNEAVATYSVDTGSCTGSYWKSVKLAKANVDAKFASLS